MARKVHPVSNPRYTKPKVDRFGFPSMTTLKMLRYRRFASLVTAARALGVTKHALRRWELGLTEPRRTNRERVERVFGRPWATLQRSAPRFGIPKGEQE